MFSWGDVLDRKNEKCAHLISSLKQSSAPLCSCLHLWCLHLEVSAGDKLQQLSLGPHCLLSLFQGCDGVRRATLVFTMGSPSNLLVFILVFQVCN